ncbi:hypothetical protein CYLTODRAFT_170848 [Cylindrobasidium torrendii FP15055 ss-10]|uniref:Uncharacterized protein n=1 Tax=Cylindrobasidium torrendii FP15055 ss-10 TaxID=1314674 RepID=A0A0D7AWG3_9AGAR|nr:hypothetical protein CYLTODRAFT_170848 [Cylindrobasidium torrendii FP15055 ss-10]
MAFTINPTTLFTVGSAFIAAAAASAVPVPRDASEHKVYVDTSACENNGRTLPQVYGISNSSGQNFNEPERFDGPTFTFTVPAYYQGHLWLYDSDNQTASSGDNTPLNVQGVDFFFYPKPTEVEHNTVTIHTGDGANIPSPITAVRFASTPSSDFIEGENGGTLESTTENDAIYVYYCEEWPVQN